MSSEVQTPSTVTAAPKVAPPKLVPGPPDGKKRASSVPTSISRWSRPCHQPASGAEDGDGREGEAPDEGDADEREPGPQGESDRVPDVGDPVARPRALLVRDVDANEEEERGEGEDDEDRELVEDRERDVDDQDRPGQHDGGERPAVRVRGVPGELAGPPDEGPEDEEVVGDLVVVARPRRTRSS